MVEEFPGNSRRITSNPAPKPASREEKPERPEVEPVITGRVIRRKTPLGKRLMRSLFSGDSNGVGSYLVRDVLIPALQATLTDVVTQGIQKAVYGETRPANRPGPNRTVVGRPIISYDRYGSTARPGPTSVSANVNNRPPRGTSSYDIGEYVLETRSEAQDVLERLQDILDKYDMVSVGDLKSLVNQTSQHTDYKYGWVDLSEAEVRRIREGYLLVLPEPDDLRQ